MFKILLIKSNLFPLAEACFLCIVDTDNIIWDSFLRAAAVIFNLVFITEKKYNKCLLFREKLLILEVK
jgi:hypothetical protein